MNKNNFTNYIKIIEKQIGRKPEGIKEISLFCPFGYPAVIKVYPYYKNRVFPTTYWLTCPYLTKEIAVLEDNNWISKMQYKLDNDNLFKEKIIKSHKVYAKKRFIMLDKKTLRIIQEKSFDIYKTLKESGVGGIKDKNGVKCLHTHVADYLINKKNPIGEIIFDKIRWPNECYKCKEIEYE